jgi:hypothetical protein
VPCTQPEVVGRPRQVVARRFPYDDRQKLPGVVDALLLGQKAATSEPYS